MVQEAASGHDGRWELGHGAGVGAAGQTLTLDIRPAPADWNIGPDGEEACKLGEVVVKTGARWARPPVERDGLLRSSRYSGGDSGVWRGTVLTKCESCYNCGGIWPFILTEHKKISSIFRV